MKTVRNKTLIRIFAILALAVFLGFTILTSLPMGANAISSQEAQRKKDAAKAQQNKELEKRKKIDAQISEVQKEIDAFQSEINEKVAKINESEEKINQLTLDLQNQNAAYNERAKSMIKRGNVSYLEIVLRSKSTQDLLTRVSVLKHVAKYDTKKLQEIRDSMTEVEELKEKLLVEKAAVVALKEEQDLLTDKKIKLEELKQKLQYSRNLLLILRKELQIFLESNLLFYLIDLLLFFHILNRIIGDITKITAAGPIWNRLPSFI